MREIKFRAWNTNTKTMGPSVSLIAILEWRSNMASKPIDTQSMVYLEYTGLKDKNGKEVFEGDLIQRKPDGNEPREIMEVIWHTENCAFSYKNGAYYMGQLDGTEVRNDMEVVGNIWEHPELLQTNN